MKLSVRARRYIHYLLFKYLGPRKSARVLIIRNDKLLVFHRKRYSRKTGQWIEYYSIPGGGIDKGESPEKAAVRELREEMGVTIELNNLVAHRLAPNYEHFVYTARIAQGEPALQQDSEEAKVMHSKNQYHVEWVNIESLTEENLRYYADYLQLIQQLGRGEASQSVLRINAK